MLNPVIHFGNNKNIKHKILEDHTFWFKMQQLQSLDFLPIHNHIAYDTPHLVSFWLGDPPQQKLLNTVFE